MGECMIERDKWRSEREKKWKRKKTQSYSHNKKKIINSFPDKLINLTLKSASSLGIKVCTNSSGPILASLSCDRM